MHSYTCLSSAQSSPRPIGLGEEKNVAPLSLWVTFPLSLHVLSPLNFISYTP